MSRCFRFLPVGVERDGTSKDVALIESIKLRREWENARAERKKEKKREKKEKKAMKSKVEKLCTTAADNGKSLFHMKSHKEMKTVAGEKLVGEDEQLEKSVLTEENVSPVSSSDSVRCNKRKRQDTDSSDNSVRRSTVIRIRLCPQKSQETCDTHKSVQMSSSSRAKSDNEVILKSETVRKNAKRQLGPSVLRSNVLSNIVARPGAEVNVKKQPVESVAGIGGTEVQSKTQIHSTDLRSNVVRESVAESDTEVTSTSSVGFGVPAVPPSKKNSILSEEAALYKTLIEDWVPPPLKLDENDCEDLGWLFDTKPRDTCAPKRRWSINDVPCLSSSSMYPKAHYVPEADLYVLPYTVPF